jgi:hypothetical protein
VSDKDSLFLELVLVVDHKAHTKFGGNLNETNFKCKEIVKIINSVNIRKNLRRSLKPRKAHKKYSEFSVIIFFSVVDLFTLKDFCGLDRCYHLE